MRNSQYPKVFVIILNYNGKRFLKRCLRSVFRMDYPNFEVVVVDNASLDGSFEEAKWNFPQGHFIKNSRNLGFAAGNNIGIRFVLEKMADYVFLLNNDAEVLKNSLTLLIEGAKQFREPAIISPVIYEGDSHKIWFSGGKIDWWRMKAFHNIKLNQQSIFETEYVTGCAMLIHKNIFRDIGLFDEDFFLYYEDADLCIRARRKGFSVLVSSNVQVNHFEQSRKNQAAKIYWLVLSGAMFFRKNSPWLKAPWLFLYFQARKIKNLIDVWLRNNNEVTQKVRQAYKDL